MYPLPGIIFITVMARNRNVGLSIAGRRDVIAATSLPPRAVGAAYRAMR